MGLNTLIAGHWLGLVWFGLLVLVGASMVLRSVRAPLHIRRGATCGACGYSVDRLDVPCPECGASLIRVGVNTPAASLRSRGSMYMLSVGWLLVVASIAIPVWSFAAAAVQRGQAQRMTGFNPGSPGSVSEFTLRPPEQFMRGDSFGQVSGPFSIAAVINEADPEADGAISLELAAAPGSDTGAELRSGESGWMLSSEWGDVLRTDADMNADLGAAFFAAAGHDTDAEAIAPAAAGLPELVQGFLDYPGNAYAAVSGVQHEGNAVFMSSGSSSDGSTSTVWIGAAIPPGSFGFGPQKRAEVSEEKPEDIAWRIEAQCDIELNEWKQPVSGSISMTLLTENDGEAWADIDVASGRTTIRSDKKIIAEAEQFDRKTSLRLFEAAGLSRRGKDIGPAIKGLPRMVGGLLEGTWSAWNGAHGSAFSVENINFGQMNTGLVGMGTAASGGLTALEYVMWGTVGAGVLVYAFGLALLAVIRRRTITPLPAA